MSDSFYGQYLSSTPNNKYKKYTYSPMRSNSYNSYSNYYNSPYIAAFPVSGYPATYPMASYPAFQYATNGIINSSGAFVHAGTNGTIEATRPMGSAVYSYPLMAIPSIHSDESASDISINESESNFEKVSSVNTGSTYESIDPANSHIPQSRQCDEMCIIDGNEMAEDVKKEVKSNDDNNFTGNVLAHCLCITNLPNSVQYSHLLAWIEDSIHQKKKFGNLKIFQLTNRNLTWCTFNAIDEDTSEKLIEALNGAGFEGHIVDCFKYDGKSYSFSAYSATPSFNDGYIQYYQNMPHLIPSPQFQSVYGYSHNYNYGGINRAVAGGFNYGPQYPYQHHRSYSTNPRRDSYHSTGSNSSRRSSFGHVQKRAGSLTALKPLGNNYNSIVFPDLDDIDNKRRDSSSMDILDDNETSCEELMKFSTSKHVLPTRLFIGNISFSSKFEELWMFLTNGGEDLHFIKQLQMKEDNHGASKGFAIVITNSEDESKYLIKKFHGQIFDNRRLVVRFDEQQEQIMLRHQQQKMKREIM